MQRIRPATEYRASHQDIGRAEEPFLNAAVRIMSLPKHRDFGIAFINLSPEA